MLQTFIECLLCAGGFSRHGDTVVNRTGKKKIPALRVLSVPVGKVHEYGLKVTCGYPKAKTSCKSLGKHTLFPHTEG